MGATLPSISGGRDVVAEFAGNLAGLAEAATAESTRSGYASDFRRFARWTMQHGVESMPADAGTVAAYLVEAARDVDLHGKERYAVATLRRWLASINQAHALHGFAKPGDDPRLKVLMRALNREKGTAQRRVRPLLTDDIVAMLEMMGGEVWPYAVSCIRDSAIILTGFGGAFRRSEVSALVRANLRHSREDGVHLVLESSKTDQEGEGRIKALPYSTKKTAISCAPCALWRWTSLLDVVDNGGGRASLMRAVRELGEPDVHICRRERPDAIGDRRPLFRQVNQTGMISAAGLSGQAIAAVVKKRAADIGLDPEMFAGHSMRAGFVTQAFRGGADAEAIKRQTGHKSDTMLSVYRREFAPLVGNAVTKIGL